MGRAADLGGDGERRRRGGRRGAAATGRATDLGGDGERQRRGGRRRLKDGKVTAGQNNTLSGTSALARVRVRALHMTWREE